jgi:hypothetical protein
VEEINVNNSFGSLSNALIDMGIPTEFDSPKVSLMPLINSKENNNAIKNNKVDKYSGRPKPSTSKVNINKYNKSNQSSPKFMRCKEN